MDILRNNYLKNNNIIEHIYLENESLYFKNKLKSVLRRFGPYSNVTNSRRSIKEDGLHLELSCRFSSFVDKTIRTTSSISYPIDYNLKGSLLARTMVLYAQTNGSETADAFYSSDQIEFKTLGKSIKEQRSSTIFIRFMKIILIR